jgi:hypothetical protein
VYKSETLFGYGGKKSFISDREGKYLFLFLPSLSNIYHTWVGVMEFLLLSLYSSVSYPSPTMSRRGR